MRWAPPPPEDEALPRARDLLSPGPSSAVLARFLEARGWSLEEARAVQAIWWPGRSCTVRYRVRGLPPRGRSRQMILCAEVRARPRPRPAAPEDFAGRFGLEHPVEEHDDLLVWAWPYDPRLSGLPDAAHGPAVRAALSLRPPGAVSVTPVRYAPGRRAVLRYAVLGREERQVLFGKVLREDALARTFSSYRGLAHPLLGIAGGRIRLARPEATDGIDGLVLFPPLAGTSLRDRLLSGGRLPSPARVAELLGWIGRAPWRGDPKPRQPARVVRSSGRTLARLLPHRRRDIEALVDTLAERAEAESHPGPTVHGDLYDAQVFVDDRFSLGLIDLEDAGPGDPLLDAANLLAHLRGLQLSVPRAGGRPLAYRALLRRVLLEDLGVPEEALGWREALCSVLLATGPFRVLSPTWPRQVEGRLNGAIRVLTRAASVA